MKQLFLALLLQLARMSMQSDQKVKIRLDILVAATFNEKANKIEMKKALMFITEKFEINQRYTRIALFDYDTNFSQNISLNDDGSKVADKIAALDNHIDDYRSLLSIALREMLAISKTQGRNIALKLFIVMTHKRPSKKIGRYVEFDITEGLPYAKDINKTGLFFIIFDNKPEPEQSSIDYLTRLCGEENLFVLFDMQGIVETIQNKIIPKVLARACESRERRCYFTTSIPRTCEGVWEYTDGYMTSEGCRKALNAESPGECQLNECHQLCDKYWPWHQDIGSCNCGETIFRRGDAPFAELSTCDKTMDCTACGRSNVAPAQTVAIAVAADRQPENEPSRDGLPSWAVGVVIVAVLATVGGIAFAWMQSMKPFKASKRSKRDWRKFGVRSQSYARNKLKPNVRNRSHSAGNPPLNTLTRTAGTVCSMSKERRPYR